MKQKLTLLFAIICGVAAMLLVKMYLKNELKRIRDQFEMVNVIAADVDIPLGTVLEKEMILKSLKLTGVPKKSVTTYNITYDQLDNLVGRKFQRTVLKNSPLLWSDINGDEQRGGGLATMVRENERAVSIPVDMTSSVTGLVEPSDHVDILGTFTFPSSKGDPQLDTVTLTILQNVTVLATGKETTLSLRDVAGRSGGRRPPSYSTVTLLVTPKEAEMLVFAMQKGRLTLTLRNPSDIGSARDLSNINFNYLEKKVGEFNDARQDRLKGDAPH